MIGVVQLQAGKTMEIDVNCRLHHKENTQSLPKVVFMLASNIHYLFSIHLHTGVKLESM